MNIIDIDTKIVEFRGIKVLLDEDLFHFFLNNKLDLNPFCANFLIVKNSKISLDNTIALRYYCHRWHTV